MKYGIVFLGVFAAWTALAGQEVKWIRAGLNTNQPVWGLEGGLQFAIHPAGFRPTEPRGLIRLGYPIRPEGGYDLVNFIAVEPVVRGRKGFSELEPSELDGVPGKRFWTGVRDEAASGERLLDPGTLSKPEPGVEQLDLRVRIERFQNGAHVFLVLSQRSDAPDELRLAIHAEPDSALLEYCILTATMGNMIRARQLWLAAEVISSLDLYPEYKGAGFAPHTIYGLNRLHQTKAGDVLAAITTDEKNPSAVQPFPNSKVWQYGGKKVTQYWRKLKPDAREDLVTAVNARYTYWQSRRPIPGGISFENFELRERFQEGQSFIFGITAKTPAELGFTSD